MAIFTFHSNYFIFTVYFLIIETWRLIIKQIKNTIPLSYASVQAHYRCYNNCEHLPKLIVVLFTLPMCIENNKLLYDHLLFPFLLQVISDFFFFFNFWKAPSLGRDDHLIYQQGCCFKDTFKCILENAWLPPSSCCYFSTLIWHFFQVYIS